MQTFCFVQRRTHAHNRSVLLPFDVTKKEKNNQGTERWKKGAQMSPPAKKETILARFFFVVHYGVTSLTVNSHTGTNKDRRYQECPYAPFYSNTDPAENDNGENKRHSIGE